MIKQSYQSLIDLGTTFQSYLLLAMRLFWGLSFMSSGWGKMQKIAEVSSFFHTLNIPFPTENAYVVSYIEFVGGLCLAIGFVSRLVSIPLAVVMLVALFTAHWQAVNTVLQDPQAFIAQSPFTYLLACLIVFAFGPGSFSVDWVLQKLFKGNS